MDDLGSTLEFVLTRNYGLVGQLAGPVVITALAIYSWRARSLIAVLFAAATAIGIVASWLRGRLTLLRVSPAEVLVRENFDSRFSSEMTIPVNQITSTGWSPGGEDDSGGLYFATQGERSYVLPGASEAQARAIMDAIAERFPDFPMAEPAPPPGDEGGMITLGLLDSEMPSGDSGNHDR